MKINFMEINDVTELFDHAIKDKYSPPYIRMYIQEDVWDFHIYRIQPGDYDGNTEGFTLEHEEISKDAVLEKMNLLEPKMEVRDAFNFLDGYDAFLAILELDEEAGYGNLEFHVVDTLEEVQEIVTADFYTVRPVEFIESVEYSENALRPHYSLQVADILLKSLLKDERAKLFSGVTVNTYGNGREQGYSLRFEKDEKQLAISFAQYRSSDSIVVYYGEASAFNISPEAYNNQRSFGSNDIAAARLCIYELLEQNVPQDDHSGTGITLHPNLALTKSIWNALKASPEYLQSEGHIECHQEGNSQGFGFVFYDGKSPQLIVATDDAKTIRVFFKDPLGLNVAATPTPQEFEVEDQLRAVNFINDRLSMTIKEKQA